MTGPLFKAEDVHKAFKDPKSGVSLTALGGLSLEIRRGEFVSVIGPSGSGKTTTSGP